MRDGPLLDAACNPIDRYGRPAWPKEERMKTDLLFWCVWCEGGGSPTVKHPTYDKARAEAQRLARNNPGRRFVVLAAAVAFEKQDVVETRFEESANEALYADHRPPRAPYWGRHDHIPF